MEAASSYLLITQKPLTLTDMGCENLRLVLKRKKFLGKPNNSWQETTACQDMNQTP
jgi:hypothetical protein